MATNASSAEASVQAKRSRDLGDYSITSHQYPDDLMGNPKYGGNFAMFFINVMSDSKIANNPSTKIVENVPQSDRGDTVGQRFTNKELVTAEGVEQGIKGGLATGNIKGGVVAGGTGAALAATIPDKGTLTRPVKQLKTAICLYMPNQLNIRYSMQYEEESMATAQMLVKGGQAIVQALSGNFGKALDQAQPVVANFALTNGGNAAKAIGLGSGIAANPKKEQIFKGVDFRTFQISYQFFPRDDKEEENVRNIIHAFKYHMHPEFKDGDGFLYIYPSEFDIVYYTGGQENKNIHKHTSCVLKEMSVNYTPQGQFNALQTGMPVQVNVDMTFLELALATKDKIGQTPEEGGL